MLLVRPTPEIDESFLGYLLRVVQENGYDSISTLLKCLPSFEEGRLVPTLSQANCPEVVAQLAFALCRTPAALEQLLLPSSVIPTYLQRTFRPQVCPLCLEEATYLRRAWDSALVTCCQKHLILLIDHCTRCCAPLSWERRLVTRCKCGFDLRAGRSPQVQATEVIAAEATQQFVVWRSSLSRYRTVIPERPDLRLQLVSFVFSILLYPRTRTFTARRATDEIHPVVMQSLLPLRAWPESFEDFLQTQLRAPFKGIAPLLLMPIAEDFRTLVNPIVESVCGKLLPHRSVSHPSENEESKAQAIRLYRKQLAPLAVISAGTDYSEEQIQKWAGDQEDAEYERWLEEFSNVCLY